MRGQLSDCDQSCAQHAAAGAACCLELFFPHLAELVVDEVTDNGDYVLLTAHTRAEPAACRECGEPSWRVHGRYRRLLRDLPAAGRPMLIALTVRRLICQNPECTVRTFAEPVHGLTQRYARRTTLLRRGMKTGTCTAPRATGGACLSSNSGTFSIRENPSGGSMAILTA